MAALVWIMVAIGLWHFTVYLPDRFWQGIVGAFLGAVVGAMLVGFLLNGLSIPNDDNTNLVQALVAIPGTVIGLAVVYFIGARQENAADSSS
ncbi:MAG: hypothetical protein ACPHCI_10330 [Solirubrobacterales bacterium]